MAITAGTPPPQSGLYDSRRDIYYAKPRWRGWMHLLWFEASLVLGTLLIVRADGPTEISAITIYSVSVSALFGTSALYHRGNWGPAWSARLQRLDHAMIFVLIAGTATPALLLTSPGVFGYTALIVLWSLTIIALGLHLIWMDAPEKLVGGTFIGLGAVSGTGIPAVWIHAGVAPAVLMIVSGLLYIVGAVSYHRRSPDPRPAVFGYHEVFHAYVCIAAACQYVAIGVFLG